MSVVSIIESRIKDTGEMRIHYEINAESRTLSVLSQQFSDRLSTIYGSPAGSHLTLSEDQVERLPHDALLCSFYQSTPPEIDGQTPDALIDEVYVELTTRRAYGERSLESAISEKRSKYSQLELIVIAVNYAMVSSTVNLDLEVRQLLVSNFSYFDSIRGRFQTACGLELKEKYHSFPIDESIRPELKIVPPQINIQSWLEFEKTIPKGRTSTKVAHLPMIDLESDDDTAPVIIENTLNGKFCTAAARLMPQHTGSGKKFSDQVEIELTGDERIEMAIRGVEGKKFKDNIRVATAAAQRKMPISLDSDVYLIDSVMSNENPDNMISRLQTLDRILREVALNAKRYTDSGTFVVRKLLGLPCYVFIKTSGYSSKDDKPIFYKVLFKGKVFQPMLFEASEELESGWQITDFMSTNRRKLEHLVSIDLQVKALRCMLLEQDKTLPKTINAMIFTLLADNNSLSVSQQVLRYYYMELYSGFGGTHTSLKVLDKFPSVMRNPMVVWLYKELKRLHPVAVIWDRSLDTDEEFDHQFEPSKDKLPAILTPWGFNIDSIDSLVLASYFGNLKNKNEQNKGHDSKVILEKIIRSEYEYHDLGRPASFSSDPGRFQSDPQWIDWGVHLLKLKVQEAYSKTWKKCFNESIASFEDQSWSELFSTKSSSTAEGEVYDPESYDIRSKVFIEMIKDFDSMNETKYHDEIPDLIKACKAHVSLFKKNQIGGVREIYILAWSFRRVIKILEDISRAMCRLHPSETLTKPSVKDSFSESHKLKVQKMKCPYTVTFSWSGDMTTWANLFVNDQFRRMMAGLLPPDLLETIMEILALHESKKLYMPRELLDNFLSTDSNFPNEDLKRLRAEFLGQTPPLICGERRPYITNHTNMMQGILHYTSSLYHCAHLEALCFELTARFKDLVCSFEVSSDDEGIKMTMGGHDLEALKKNAKLFKESFPIIKNSVDLKFGIRTSWVKSTLSVSPLFEFNSMFFLRNTAAVPFIKFVARSIDDNVCESLHARVAGFYSLLRQVRESGASGQLCHQISKLQSEALLRNFGKGNCSTFDEVSYNGWPNLSILGKYRVMEPEIAGLVGAEYANWFECTISESARKIMKKFGVWTVIADADPEMNTSYQLFERKKFHRTLSDLGISERAVTVDDARALLIRDKTIDELKRLIRLRACSPGVASSFSWHARTDNVQLAPFLLSSPIFNGKTIPEIIESAAESKDCGVQQLFPSHSEYLNLRTIVESTHTWYKLSQNPARSKKMYHPLISSKEHRRLWKQVLSRLWFDEPFSGGDKLYEIHRSAMEGELDWIRNTVEDTLRSSPFETFPMMMGFFDSYGKSAHSSPFLTRGPSKGYNMIEDIISLNTVPGHQMVLRQLDDHHLSNDNTLAWLMLEDRINSWTALLRGDRGNNQVIQDIEQMVPDDDQLDQACKLSDRSRRSTAVAMRSLVRGYTEVEYLLDSDPGVIFYRVPQRMEDGFWTGQGIILLRIQSGVIELEVDGSQVVSYLGEMRADSIKPYLTKMGLFFQANTIYRKGSPLAREILKLIYDNGFRLATDSGGISNRLYGHSSGFVMSVDPPDFGPATNLLNDYLNNITMLPSLSSLVPRDWLSEKIARLIRSARQGLFRMRLFERLDQEVLMEDPIDDPDDDVKTTDDLNAWMQVMKDFQPDSDDEDDNETWAHSFFYHSQMVSSDRPVRAWAYEQRVDSAVLIKWASAAETLVRQGPDAYRTEFINMIMLPDERPVSSRIWKPIKSRFARK